MNLAKKSLSLFFVVCIMLSTPHYNLAYAEPETSLASADISIQPLWLYTSSVVPSMKFEGGQAYVRAEVFGHANATKIVVDVMLDKKVNGIWLKVNTWSSIQSNSTYLDFQSSWPADSGYEYRLTISGTVFSGQNSEPISHYFISKY